MSSTRETTAEAQRRLDLDHAAELERAHDADLRFRDLKGFAIPLVSTLLVALSVFHYYTAGYGRAVFEAFLKKRIVYSDHSLATDSVFAEVQLVSCRNVLIYFDRELQNRAVGLFREALCRKGFLGIGAKESLRFTGHADGFAEFVPVERIFRKRDVE